MAIIPSSTGLPAAAGGSIGPFLLMGGSTFLGGLANKRAGEATAASERKAATNARISGFFKDRILRNAQKELQSMVRFQSGSGGMDVTQGSPLDAYLQATRETELDIVHNKNAVDSEVQAHFDAANIAERTGSMALTSSLIGGTAKILGAKEDAAERLKLQALLKPR
jgi:hypothetical protein